jgi:hypothetical protein
VQPRHPLDGGSAYNIVALLADPKRGCLWLAVWANFDTKKRCGLWRYDGAAGRLDGPFFETTQTFIGAVAWDGDRLVFTQGGIVRFDPATQKGERLGAYGRVSYGKRVWAMVGDDLFVRSMWLWTQDGKKHELVPRLGEVDDLLRHGAGAILVRRSLPRLWQLLPRPTGGPP